MPQVDLETLVSACAGGSTDRKIACETLAHNDNSTHLTVRPIECPDSPPESFWLSKDAELDWFDRNAFYERKDSTKGSSNSTNLNPNLNTNSNSQRFSLNLKSKAAILGLPKPQNSCLIDPKNRRTCKQGNLRLFPKRTGSVGNSETPLNEPSSPKVSCIGRVRSKKERKRRSRARQNSSESIVAVEVISERSERRKSGFFESFRAIFRSRNRQKKPELKSELQPKDSPQTKTETNTIKPRCCTAHEIDNSLTESVPRKSISESEPFGLGSMIRFASGRRSESWGVGDTVHVS
ncbi:Calcium/calmodulin-dependent protein kinase [Quillaja saponaria]|uniref:Calcium/calmodulin-dependent protein kinase n=1 Tax=Quillaja saponaria TaxID=32244 RepID=A0AAD7PYN9_QUISA|nr:Calcium/calmodulin-dependent protein kinase [Quillaja saponaria]